MTRQQLTSQPCPLGATHRLTQPIYWIGASCFKCHKVWTGTGLVQGYPEKGG